MNVNGALTEPRFDGRLRCMRVHKHNTLVVDCSVAVTVIFDNRSGRERIITEQEFQTFISSFEDDIL